MKQEKIDRINAFTRLARERALTAEEKAERETLRQEYLAEWRLGTLQVLESTYVVDERGGRRKLGRRAP